MNLQIFREKPMPDQRMKESGSKAENASPDADNSREHVAPEGESEGACGKDRGNFSRLRCRSRSLVRNAGQTA